jgi:hypothetical protein
MKMAVDAGHVVHDDFFATVDDIDKATAEEASDYLDCQDLANAQSYDVALEKVRRLLGDDTIADCDSPAVFWRCHEVGMDMLRALCPIACGCATPIVDPSSAQGGSLTGFFGAPRFGCPSKCTVLSSASSSWIATTMGPLAPQCDDVPVSVWESVRPVENHPAKLYFKGLFDYVTFGDSAPFANYIFMIASFMTTDAGDALGLNANGVTVTQYVQGVMNGTVKDEFQLFNWNIYPGVPHPRGLTGCEFLTSFEMSALMGLSLCDVGHFRSLRFVCPTSCGCDRKNNSGQECPASCATTS